MAYHLQNKFRTKIRKMNEKTSILLCEGDLNLAHLLSDFFTGEGFSVKMTDDATEGFRLFKNNYFDICLIDTFLRNKSGISLLQDIRSTKSNIPILMLTDKTGRDDIINTYKRGADDCVIKPFSIHILMCKINVFVHRFKEFQTSQQTEFDFESVRFSGTSHMLNDQHLSARESDLLLLLLQNVNRLVERKQILKQIWQKEDYFSSKSLSVYITRLRILLRNIPTLKIVACSGKGYKLVKL